MLRVMDVFTYSFFDAAVFMHLSLDGEYIEFYNTF